MFYRTSLLKLRNGLALIMFFVLFAGTSLAATFTNSTAITITDHHASTPYGTAITVSGLTGTVSSVKVTINGFSHAFPEDVGMLLVGPTGAAYLLQDGAGSDPDMVNITYSFADGFPMLPSFDAWPAGTYRATNYLSDTFATPAPAAFQKPGPFEGASATFASVFNGTNPNGTWTLYVQDFAAPDSGQIAGGWSLDITTASAPTVKAPVDFDGDHKTDISIFRPSVGEWWYSRSSDNVVRAGQFGTSTDIITPGDFTGDGKTDWAFFRPSTGFWFIVRSEDGSFFSFPFGSNGDIPMPADFDGDGKTDPAVFRPSSGTWFISQSSGAGTIIASFGSNGDKPVAFDYDGDGKADIGIVRDNQTSGNKEWWIQRSNLGLMILNFGIPGDKTVPGDYTGEGKADVALFRPANGTWYILRSEDFSFFSFPWGQAGDIPAPGDYDGDGKTDAAVFRPSSSTWFINRTGGQGPLIAGFGASTDNPVPSSLVR